MSRKKVAFIGLGVMGFPMAGHLQKAGYDVCVYNRTELKAQRWVATCGGRSASTPAAAAAGAELVFACVGNDDDLRSVMLGPQGAFAGMTAGALVIDHTTASAEVARELNATAQARQLRFLDAPVSGGQAGAENGVLTVMVGGDAKDFAEAEPAIHSYARSVKLMGASGAGQLTKMVNQRGDGQLRAVGTGLIQHDTQVLAHPVNGKSMVELIINHGLIAVFHLPGLCRTLGDYLHHGLWIQA